METFGLYGFSSQFQDLPKTQTFTDQLPLNTVHSGSVTIDAVVINANDVDNCYFTISLNGFPKTVLATGINGSYSKTFDSVHTYYKYKNDPVGIGSFDGNGLNTIEIKTTTPGCTLRIGAFSYSTRYTYSQNATAGSFYFSQCINRVNCNYGTLRFPRNGKSYCACWSGAWDRSCTMDNANYTTAITKPWAQGAITRWERIADLDATNMASRDFGKNWVGHPTCPNINNWGTVEDLATKNPPSMEAAFFDNARLNIRVSFPMTNGRAETVAFLNDIATNVTHPYCTYPISNYIYKEVIVCKDVFHFDIPWELAQNCYWKITQEETHQVYKGQVILAFQEYLESITEWRFTQSVLRIKLRFQRFVAVTLVNDVAVFNQPNATAAITR
jgi:hypothetical protein